MFVRPLSMEEGRKLQRVTRIAKDPVRLRRAIAVLMSGQGRAVRDITSLMQVSENYVRDVIHAFNERVRGAGPTMERRAESGNR
ncbi:helix-turn-helix domain-containing protein [Actinosynnema sp. NPDC059797]